MLSEASVRRSRRTPTPNAQGGHFTEQATPNVTLQAAVFYDDSSSDPFATLQMSLPIPVCDRNQVGIAEAQTNVLAAEQAIDRQP